MRMLLIAASMVLPMIPAEAAAQSWYRVGGNGKTMTYVDLTSLRPLGDKIVGVTQSVYKNPLSGGVHATRIRSEYDCDENYFRTLEYSYYDASGGFILTEASKTINERKVPSAASLNEGVLRFVCFREGGTAVAGDLFVDARAQFPKYAE